MYRAYDSLVLLEINNKISNVHGSDTESKEVTFHTVF